jgi:ribonuclease E
VPEAPAGATGFADTRQETPLGERERDGRRRRGRRREAYDGGESAQAALDYEGTTEPAAQPTAHPVAREPEAPVAAKLPEPPRAAEPIRIEPYVLPATDLQAVAQAAGLEWVSSDAEKVRAVQEAMAAEPKPVHVPREPKPVVIVDEGPLVLVETRKDLSQVKLPFEAAGPGA